MIRSPTTSPRGRGRPPRTMSTRQHQIQSTSGSGNQHPVAPNIDDDQQHEDAAIMHQRSLSLSPMPGRRSASTPATQRRGTAYVAFRQLPHTFRQPSEQTVDGMDDETAAGRTGDPRLEQRQRQPGSAPQPVPNVHAAPPHQVAPPAQFGVATLADLTAIIRAIRAPPPPLPTFSGLDHEDPHTFLRDCEENFAQSATESSQWTRLAGGALKDAAGKWWEVYKSLSLTWKKFREVMIHRFANTSSLMRLHAQLYSRKQTERESTAVFLQQKYLLTQRLIPDAPEEETTAILLESLRPSIRRVIRAASPRTFGELFDRAVDAEADEAEEQPRREQRKEEPRQKPTSPTQNETDRRREGPPCEYCPGFHYHRDCPVLAARRNTASGNWRTRAAAADAPTAPARPAEQPN